MATLTDRAPGLQEPLMIEERLEKIETKCAYQEDLIEELNKTVYLQQQKLTQLEATCESLARHIAALYESASNESKPANERPPHY